MSLGQIHKQNGLQPGRGECREVRVSCTSRLAASKLCRQSDLAYTFSWWLLLSKSSIRYLEPMFWRAKIAILCFGWLVDRTTNKEFGRLEEDTVGMYYSEKFCVVIESRLFCVGRTDDLEEKLRRKCSVVQD